MQQAQWIIGLMSGTSLDGVDAALLRTDGERIAEFGAHLTLPYDAEMRELLRIATREQVCIAEAAHLLTLRHAEAVLVLLRETGMKAEQVAMLGFHGQTVLHAPARGLTWQIGDPSLLAARTGISVVADFRTADVAQGGQGAPLVPLYHRALAEWAELLRPVAFLNLGGISNLTWIGPSGELCAFDCGPANALLNEWMLERTGQAMDTDGRAAKAGRVSNAALEEWMQHSFFKETGPKSLDRHSFSLDPIRDVSTEDGAATLTAFAALCVELAIPHLPAKPEAWILCGGGTHNPAMVEAVRLRLGNVKPAREFGFQADAMEAQAFAYLAARHMRGLPTSLPETTGARRAVVGGAFYPHGSSAAR